MSPVPLYHCNSEGNANATALFFYYFPELAWGRYAHANSARTEQAIKHCPSPLLPVQREATRRSTNTHILMAMASRAIASIALVPTGPSMLHTIQSFDRCTCTTRARRLCQNKNSWVVPYSSGSQIVAPLSQWCRAFNEVYS